MRNREENILVKESGTCGVINSEYICLPKKQKDSIAGEQQGRHRVLESFKENSMWAMVKDFYFVGRNGRDWRVLSRTVT